MCHLSNEPNSGSERNLWIIYLKTPLYGRFQGPHPGVFRLQLICVHLAVECSRWPSFALPNHLLGSGLDLTYCLFRGFVAAQKAIYFM